MLSRFDFSPKTRMSVEFEGAKLVPLVGPPPDQPTLERTQLEVLL
jgi:hypothetical protein